MNRNNLKSATSTPTMNDEEYDVRMMRTKTAGFAGGRIGTKPAWAALPAFAVAFALAAVIAFIAALAPDGVRAQTPDPDPLVTVEVSSTDITTNDILTLTVVIHDQPNVYLPQLPTISGMMPVGTARSFTSAYSEGSLKRRAEFRYTFRPIRAGDVEIGPITVRLQNATHATEPIRIAVAQGPLPVPISPSAPGGGALPRLDSLVGQNYFSEAEVDDDAPYIGEQVTHTFRFYSTDAARRPTYTAPDFAGFWNAGELPKTDGAQNESGRLYYVTEIDTILFPALAGHARIEPGSMTVFTGFFGSGRAEFPSETVSVFVKPLPPGEPPTFAGAVGEYQIQARVDRDDIRIGEPVNMSVLVSGAGNFQHLPDPIWPDAPGWRAYDGDSETRSEIADGGVVRGAKIYQRTLIPETSGELTIPPVEFSYFDPDLEEYATASTNAIHVRVAPVAGGAADAGVADSEIAPAVAEDIRHIKPIASAARSASEPLGGNPLYLWLWTLPALAAAAAFGWRFVQRRREAIADARRPALAGELALSRLSGADSEDSAADVAALALRGYLEAALGERTRGMTPDETADLAIERGASVRTANKLRSALRKLDETRFGPADDPSVQSMPREIAETVRELSAEISP